MSNTGIQQNGWREVKLGDVVELVIDHRGKTPKKLGGDWSNSGYRAISARSIKNGKLVNEDKMNILPENLYVKWMKEEIKYGDILLTSEAPLGEHLIWKLNEKVVLSQRIFGIRTKKETLDPFFFNHFIDSDYYQHELKSRQSGTTVTGIRQVELLKTMILLPPLHEQKAIAEVLSSLDDKIDLLHRQNKTLEDMAQALFRKWFIEEADEEWEVRKLGDEVEIKRGGSPRPINDFITDDGLRWLKISDATAINSPYIFQVKEHIKKEGLSKTVYLKEKSLVLSNSATPGLPKFLAVDSCIHDGWLYFLKSNLPYIYLYLFFVYHRNEIIQHGSGTIFTNLKTDILKNWEIKIPEKEYLERFMSFVQPKFEKIYQNQFKIITLEKLRNTLLPKLMGGTGTVIKL